MKRSRNIFLIGPMGAGKSTIGRQLADMLKMNFYDTDTEIERKCGADINWIFDLEGEEGFRKREEKVVQELTELQGIVLATGGGIVNSAANRSRLSARGSVVYLKATVDQLLDRTSRDKTRPLLQTSDPRETLERLNTERQALYEEVADYVVETDQRGVRTVAAEIVKIMTEE
ncbi:MAG: shikimate kinase AroK [Gammaproteobacteria bacterium]|nr:shikimate kinase AroK [Gammaproteobacteria bacterium]